MAQGTTGTTPADAVSGAAQAVSEAVEIGKKMLTGTRLLNRLRDRDVEIATTPKDRVWQQDKVTLYHFRPLAEQAVKTPVLITYGLVGRWTMTDLQDDRSLVQNLLRLGLDLYVVDWGNPSRADRWLTLDEEIRGHDAHRDNVLQGGVDAHIEFDDLAALEHQEHAGADEDAAGHDEGDADVHRKATPSGRPDSSWRSPRSRACSSRRMWRSRREPKVRSTSRTRPTTTRKTPMSKP